MNTHDNFALPEDIRPVVRAVDLGTPTKIHLIGIGGAGMSAIATVLVALGHTVTGSDLKESATITNLEALGVTAKVGHSEEAIANDNPPVIVARSSAIPDHNVEVQAALAADLPLYSRAEILTAITNLRRCVVVAGTHGKTTTSSMLSAILRACGREPSFIIGGEVNEIGSGAVWDSGDLLVVEGDESDGTILALHADAAILTSAEPDHLDLYGDADTVTAAYITFLREMDGPRVLCVDDPAATVVAAEVPCLTYGTSAEASWRIVGFEQGRGSSNFVLEHDAGRIDVEVAAPGLHNARNATAALLMAVELGVPMTEAVAGLRRYSGVARRYEYRGHVGGITFVDDYAHLPAEVSVTVHAATGGDWGRVIAVFQPHRFTRTAALGETFAGSFDGVDTLAVTEIYSAGEAPIPGVSGKLVADAVASATPSLPVHWLPHRSDLVDWLLTELRAGDLCLTLGAGDLTTLPDELMVRMGGSS